HRDVAACASGNQPALAGYPFSQRRAAGEVQRGSGSVSRRSQHDGEWSELAGRRSPQEITPSRGDGAPPEQRRGRATAAKRVAYWHPNHGVSGMRCTICQLGWARALVCIVPTEQGLMISCRQLALGVSGTPDTTCRAGSLNSPGSMTMTIHKRTDRKRARKSRRQGAKVTAGLTWIPPPLQRVSHASGGNS